MPLTGIPIVVTRIYDSLDANVNGDFGFGWRIQIRDTNLVDNVGQTGAEDFGLYQPFFDNARVYVTLPDGTREAFRFVPKGRSLLFDTIFSPRFIAEPGSTSKLTVGRHRYDVWVCRVVQSEDRLSRNCIGILANLPSNKEQRKDYSQSAENFNQRF